MKTSSNFSSLCLLSGTLLLASCAENEKKVIQSEMPITTTAFGGFESQILHGEHLVLIAGCHDCHTPKKMGAHGPELDMDLALSGHPAKMPAPEVNRTEIESKGLAVTKT